MICYYDFMLICDKQTDGQMGVWNCVTLWHHFVVHFLWVV